MQYSFAKGLWKTLLSVVVLAVAFTTFAGVSDLVIWDLFEQYLKPVLAGLTVGGLLTLAMNWLKVKFA